LGQVDVFHASNWTLPKTQAAVVTTIHDLTFLKYPQEHLPYYIDAHKRQLERAKNKATAIIAVSQSTKNDLVNYGLAADKIRVVYEAAGKIFKPVKGEAVKKKYQLDKPFILSVGTLEPRKNLDRLIEAWQKLDNRPELVIVGKFGWGEGIKPIKGVRLMGFVPDEDLPRFYSAAKAFVYPSLYEGFGLPVVEALSCGCPVVTSNRSSLPEVGGEAAVYVDPESAASIAHGIEEAIKSATQLKKAGLEQAKKFSWEKTARETLAIYKDVYDHRH
jgi:glycosyltransferase involved in cell wall biosynthesis